MDSREKREIASRFLNIVTGHGTFDDTAERAFARVIAPLLAEARREGWDEREAQERERWRTWTPNPYRAAQHVPMCNVRCHGDAHWLHDRESLHEHDAAQREVCAACADQVRGDQT